MSKLRGRLTFANVMSVIAVLIALGGTGYAAFKLPKNSVGTKQIRKNAVKASKVAKDSITGAKINESTLAAVPNAANARSAGNAETLGGLSAAQITEALKVRCPAGMRLVVGVCFESVTREKQKLFEAMTACGLDGRRLPSQSELIAFQ